MPEDIASPASGLFHRPAILPDTLPPGLVPSAFDLAAMAAMAATFVLLMLGGRFLSRGAGRHALVDMLAGWGALALVMTLWGTLTPLSLAWPAALVPLLGVAGLADARVRPDGAYWRTLGRCLAIALPLIAIMSAALPGEVDTFLYWLPNAAQLHDHGTFPADGGPTHFSLYPAHPYNLQFLTYVAGLALPDFARGGPIHANVLLNVLFAGLLAALADAARGRREGPPGWTTLAVAFLVAMPLNPAFLPEFNLSSYGESTIGIALAVSVLASLGLREALAEGRRASPHVVLLALALAALVDIKQTSVVFAGGTAIGLHWLLRRDGMARLRAAGIAAVALVPALAEHAAWRAHVTRRITGGENELLPVSEWHVAEIPRILGTMAKESLEKGYFTLLVILVLALALAAWRGRGRGRGRGLDRAEALLIAAAGLYILNVVFLFTMYVIQFPGVMGPNAQSFYRYCTQNGPLFLVALVPAAIGFVNARPRLSARLSRPGPTLVGLWLVLPFLAIFYLRFDQRMPVPLLWNMAEALSTPAKSGKALAILVPSGEEAEQIQVRVAVQVTSPRRDDIRYRLGGRADERSLARLHEEGFDRILLSCVPPALSRFGAGGAAVLARTETGWEAIAHHSFPAPDAPGIWRAARMGRLTECR